MALVISHAVLAKIAADDHGNISEKEIHECFNNHCGRFCYDHRPEHLDRQGNPSPWFVSETNQKRRLKIMFVRDGENVELKSAYPATDRVAEIFDKYSKEER